jgi:hypothetical protein
MHLSASGLQRTPRGARVRADRDRRALILIGFLWKIHVEEKHMRENFPEYFQYCKKTAALIPLLY